MRLATLGVILALRLTGFAQTVGQVTGVVTDPSGSIVVGAMVTIINSHTNVARTATTNSAGNYTFAALQPGLYNLKAEMRGFQGEVREGMELQVEQIARIDFHLKVGAVTQTVEVLGGAPLLNTESATVGTVIDNKRIVELPLNGRSFTQLIALSPNVAANFVNSGGQAATRQGGDRAAQEISIAGSRREYTNYTLDGVENTDPNFNTYALLPSIDALQEFKVETGVYPAEFGHLAAQVNVSTASGTNEYHGTVFDFLRNNYLDARPYGFTSVVPKSAPFKWNQYGFTLGGPVWIPKLFNGKNRLFFLSNYEGFNLRQQTQTVYSTFPAAFRSGDFSQALPGHVIKDPLTGNPFPKNIIPMKRLDPFAIKLLQYYPAPNIPGSGLSNNYLALDNVTEDKYQLTERVDFVQNSKSSWFGRYSMQHERGVIPALDQNGMSLATDAKQMMINNTLVLTPSLLNEFRIGYLRFFNNYAPELANKTDVVKQLGLPGLLSDPAPPAWGIPQINLSDGFSGFGNNADGPYTIWDHLLQFVDDMSWTRGNHAFKFGADIDRTRYNVTGNQYARGLYGIQNQATGYTPADFMLGYVHDTSDAAALAVAQFRQTSQDYYFQDSWKVRSNITLSYGLRYEYVPAYSDKAPLVNIFVPQGALFTQTPNAPASTHPCFVRSGTGNFYQNTVIRFGPGICTARDGRMGSNLVQSDAKNFAPRLGIAWSPTLNWTVRAGAGIFYTQDTGNPVFDMARNLSGRVINTANIAIHDLTFENPFTISQNVCGLPSPPYVCITSPFVLGNDYHRRTPYVEQYELNIQRQLGKNTAFEIGYLGTQGHRLERIQYFNQPNPGPGSTASRSPWPEFGFVQEVIGLVNSNYNSLSAKLTRRMSNGFTYLLGYTYSKSIDDGSGERIIGTDNIDAQNEYCIKCERALSSFDQRQRFVASMLYQLPIGKGRKYLNSGWTGALAGGWDLGVIWTMTSGSPVDIYDGKDQSNTGVGQDRPNAVPGQTWQLGNPSPKAWFNVQAFALQPQYTFGDFGRNVVIGPRLFTVDSSIKKDIQFSERRYVQLRLDAFNTFNHPNFGDPGNALTADRLGANGVPIPGTGSFGRITSTKTGVDMRELQVSLKVVF